jgi:GntR family transcriptional regulator
LARAAAGQPVQPVPGSRGTGLRQRNDVLALRAERNPDAARRLELSDDAELVYLERLRWADEEPLTHDRIWLPGALAAPLLDAEFSNGGLYDEPAARCGVRLTGGRERISAVVPDKATRSLLAVPRAVACLLIERTGCLHRRPAEWRMADSGMARSTGYLTSAGSSPAQ